MPAGGQNGLICQGRQIFSVRLCCKVPEGPVGCTVCGFHWGGGGTARNKMLSAYAFIGSPYYGMSENARK